MRIKLDENLGTRGAEELREAGYDVATVAGQGLLSAPDPSIIEVCREEERCLVTLDLGFSNPFVYPPRRFAGLAVLRLPEPFEDRHLKRALETFIDRAAGRSLKGRLWIVEMTRVREYDEDS